MVVPEETLTKLVPESKEATAALLQLEGLSPQGVTPDVLSAYFVPEDSKVTQRCPLDRAAFISK